MKRLNRKTRQAVKKEPCIISESCLGEIDPDHIKTFGAGGEDTVNNMMPLCRKHHAMRHARGIGYMMDQFPQYKTWLLNHGHSDLIERIKSKREFYKSLDRIN